MGKVFKVVIYLAIIAVGLLCYVYVLAVALVICFLREFSKEMK